jgi:serine O-acetyltransferase
MRHLAEALRRDRARYATLGGWHRSLGFWIGATYRFGAWSGGLRPALLRAPLLALYRVAKLPWKWALNVDIPANARIGPGLCLIHPRNVVLGPDVCIGENCLIFHEVTLATGAVAGQPRIGNDVDIYVGARVLGGIEVGDGSMIGANAVVTRSVPPGSVVVTAPSHILPRSLAPAARRGGKQRQDG